MAKLDPAIVAHLEWLGFVQPVGLVVSAPALVRAGAILDSRDAEGQALLRSCVEEREVDSGAGMVPVIPDFVEFARSVLNWSFSPKGYAGTEEEPIPTELEVHLPEYGETLRPDFAVRELDPKEGAIPWQLLVRVLEPSADFDKISVAKGKLEASPHGRMERLLRQTGAPAGFLFNGRVLRLVSAPRGESSGWLDFPVADMIQTAGRPISTALRLLLGQTRLLALPKEKRLAALLEDSRKFQNEVSERLAEQVLHGLYELLRGLQSAHDASKGELLRGPLVDHPDEIYRAMLTVILRLVFLLFSEERDMLPTDKTFVRHYSLAGLCDRLRSDAALYPDTMNQRYGAWAQLVVLFRLIHDGAECGDMRLPKRHGVLFDPDRFPFLEGRTGGGARQIHERIEPPLIPDGTIFRALDKLLVLDGERISYRALDVEQIGSVYETMMGFRLETASGRSIAIKAGKKHGAPSTVNLDALLEQDPKKRKKWVQDLTDRKITDKVNKAVKEAATLEDLHVALNPVLDREATPDLVPTGTMVLQPSEERRRSGSHYTPRELTEPIVRKTLEPILFRLRKAEGSRPPTPDKLLELKVCDPAMGSGAFLVEVCRQIGDALVESWHFYDEVPEIPSDEDEVVFARRLVAQRCLYGVDRNPVAVDLSKVSLWLATLAREHALTFVDHALRHGDSLVGLHNTQIAARDWSGAEPLDSPNYQSLKSEVEKVGDLRRQIREANENVSDFELRCLLEEAETANNRLRTYGDILISGFFAGSRDKERKASLNIARDLIMSGDSMNERIRLDGLRDADPPLVPFHWELEFPEVFERDNPGFDVFVGNPPFLGGKRISTANGDSYRDWLATLHAETNSNADLVAHFFRRAFTLVRVGGVLGLIATNSISQGHTRDTGLRWICEHGGVIYSAVSRMRWPGRAAVVIAVVYISKCEAPVATMGKEDPNIWSPDPPYLLDGREVDFISAYLFHAGSHDKPKTLLANAGRSFHGVIVLGSGFLFDDRSDDSTPLEVMNSIIASDPKSAELIRPYIGGKELYSHPSQQASRYVIDFGDMTEARARDFYHLFDIVENKVHPQRASLKRAVYRNKWWMHGERQPALQSALKKHQKVLVAASRGDRLAFAFQPASHCFSYSLIVFLYETMSAFSVLQSRCHEIWARMFGSTLKEDLAYNPTDCFETFPFPEEWQDNRVLESTGQTYYDFRAMLMMRNSEGLTKTYNRFHDPEEKAPDVVKLRELHAAMDRAMLNAYGWEDISTDCEFLLDYEIDQETWGRKKMPYRLRWPQSIQDEVLARLLELNGNRAKEEKLQGGLF